MSQLQLNRDGQITLMRPDPPLTHNPFVVEVSGRKAIVNRLDEEVRVGLGRYFVHNGSGYYHPVGIRLSVGISLEDLVKQADKVVAVVMFKDSET